MLSRPIRLMNRPPSRYVLHTLPSYNPHPVLPHTWKTTGLYNLFGLHFHPWRPPAATTMPSYGPFSWFLLLLGCNQTSLRRLGYKRIRGQSFRPIKQRYRQPLTTITIHIHHKSFHFWSIPFTTMETNEPAKKGCVASLQQDKFHSKLGLAGQQDFSVKAGLKLLDVKIDRVNIQCTMWFILREYQHAREKIWASYISPTQINYSL